MKTPTCINELLTTNINKPNKPAISIETEIPYIRNPFFIAVLTSLSAHDILSNPSTDTYDKETDSYVITGTTDTYKWLNLVPLAKTILDNLGKTSRSKDEPFYALANSDLMGVADILFSEIRLCNKPLLSFSPSISGNYDNTRLYTSVNESGYLKFIALGYSCSDGDYEDQWCDPSLEVNIIMSGDIIYDGVRHMTVGEEGYLFHPDVKFIADCFNFLTFNSPNILPLTPMLDKAPDIFELINNISKKDLINLGYEFIELGQSKQLNKEN